jgi:hypothetical protein
MTHTRDAKLDSILDHVLTECGAEAFAEPSYTAAPFMWAIPRVLDPGPCADPNHRVLTECLFLELRAIRVPFFHSVRDLASD